MLRLTLMAATVLLACNAPAQDDPRDHAEKLGSVHFETSCNAPAQMSFNRATALLHSFQFSHAIERFHEVLKDDPTCAIAYWGMALSDWSNPFAPGAKDQTQLQAGRENADRGAVVRAKSERERDYISAVGKLYASYETIPQRARLLAYRDAMAEVAAKYPADHEAQIFYALSISAAEDPSDKTYVGRLKAGAILEELFEEEPSHPGLAHYIIHTYDVPALARRALVAARRYSVIAPDAPHALHMPSHTFTRTGNWRESIKSNIAAAAAARRDGQTAEELHATDYEIYAYLQTGQIEAAKRIVDSLPATTLRFDPSAVIGGAGGPAVGYFALAAIPARYALERADWEQASQLTVRETQFPHTDAITWFARGLGAARVGQVTQARECAAALRQIQARLSQAGEDYWARQVEIQAITVEAWISLAKSDQERNKRKRDNPERDAEEALRLMKSAAQLEDGTEKSAVTPGPLAPARELLGEMFLKLNEPAQALKEFQATLKKEPGRLRTIQGEAQAKERIANLRSTPK
jgi:1,2-phenylacetyl-CoA epoxidase PaaB subunit